MKTLEGQLTAQGMKVAIVVARFNEFITSKLLSGAIDCLERQGWTMKILLQFGSQEHSRSLWQRRSLQ